MQLGRTSLNWQPLQDHRLFERLCAFIYARKWDDPNVMFVGGPGTRQLGLDLVEIDQTDEADQSFTALMGDPDKATPTEA